MKSSREWKRATEHAPLPPHLEPLDGREGDPTLKAHNTFLHSQYRPREEAARLVESAALDPKRPVLAIGLGLGYHILELLARGFEVACVEPDPAVVPLALAGPLKDREDLLIGAGDLEAIAASEAFRRFAAKLPAPFVHPPTAHIHPGYAQSARATLARCGLAQQRLGIAIIGPMYGGSLPITSYLERAFRRLGHRTLLADNSAGWDLYNGVTRSVKHATARGQLTAMLVNLLGEWSYARVMGFAPDICIVMAQAPVSTTFPARLAKERIATAFWYIENWRHLAYWKDIARHYDYFFHIQPGPFEHQLTQAGCARHAFVQTACDPEIHRPVALTPEESVEFGCDLSFAGAGYFNRNQVFSALTDYALRLWGVEWTARELLPFVRQPDQRFTPEQFAKIVAGSKINLNLHSSATHPGVDPQCDAINPRVFEIAACGGFQLCDPCKGLEACFDFQRELPVYRDLKELRRLIDHYLAHEDERRAIAQCARDRALRDHTYDRRAQQMLDLLIEACGERILEKGIRIQRTVGEVCTQIASDSPLADFLATLPQDVPFTQEHINPHVPEMGAQLAPAQAMFAYLRELRNSAEDLLKET